jgi:hypothetical protein
LFQLRAIHGDKKRDRPLVAVGVLTRDRPDYLKRALRGIEAARHKSFDTHLMVWNNGVVHIPSQTHGYGHNAGQHVAMNRLIDEAVLIDADYFVRVDEDCFFETRDWLKKLVALHNKHLRKYRRTCILSPLVHGLRNPPKPISRFNIGKYRMEAVDILGGICRFMPMGVLRYWRWDERMSMGFGEATTFATYCKQQFIPMLRCMNIHVSHGESTDAQEAQDEDWAYEHAMLQIIPYGL